MSGMRHPGYNERGAMTNAPGPPSGPRWRCACGGWNPATEPACRFTDCDERRPGAVMTAREPVEDDDE